MVVDEGDNVWHHVLPNIHLIEEPKGVDQGINLKGCLYFIGKGNLKFSLSK
jgi:hypothetical protein